MPESNTSIAEPDLAGEVENLDVPNGGRVGVQWYGSSKGAKSAIALLPALGVSVRYYRELARVLAGNGHVVAAISLREASPSFRELRQHDYGYKDVLDTDLAAVIPAIQKRVGSTPLYLVGHSLGG